MPGEQIEAILAAWREIERQLASVEGESDEADELRAEASRLRDEYQRLVELEMAGTTPAPAGNQSPA